MTGGELIELFIEAEPWINRVGDIRWFDIHNGTVEFMLRKAPQIPATFPKVSYVEGKEKHMEVELAPNVKAWWTVNE